MIFAVKCREKGKKRFAFLGSKGRLSYNRVHAIMFPSEEKAQEFIITNAPDNPDFEFKASPF